MAALLLAGCGGGSSLLLPGDGEATHIKIVGGDKQSGRVGEALTDPLVVQVTDSRDRPVNGVSVAFEFTSGGPGAQIVPATATTDANGKATVQVVLGTTIGPQTGQASVVTQGAKAPAISFTVMAVPENANGIAVASGDDQTGAAGSKLGQPLVVQVTDAFGNPISGVRIDWSVEGGGSVSDASTTTDDSGLASVERTLGPTAGPQSTLASSVGLAGSPVTFTHTATAGNAAGLSIVSGNNQTAPVGTRLPADLVVRLVDGAGNGVPGTAVTWVVGTGGGSVTPQNGTTDDQGRALAQWTLGPNSGQNRVDAVVSGIGIANFTATGTTGAPAALAIVTQPSGSAQNGVRFERQPVVQLRDAGGHDVGTSGIVITAQLSGSGGELTGTSQRATDGSGRAAFTDLAISGATGQRTLVFTASGYSGATSSSIDVRPIGTTTTITSDSPNPSVSGSAFTVGFRVTSPGPVPTGSVTVTASGAQANCSGTLQNGAGSCSLTLNRVGDRTLRATYSGGPGLNGSSATAPHRVNPAPPQNRPPHADYNWNCQGLTCQFTDKSSDPDGDQTLASWSWNFGDGTSSAERNPSHTFPGARSYLVTLTVTDNGGANNTASAHVDPPANKAPHAEFEVHCTDQTCSFTDRSSDDDGTIAGWHWEFGDGQSSTDQNPSHPYAAPVHYNVTLTVTDNGGATDFKTHDANPTPPPPPPNQPPTATDDAATTSEDVPVTINVLANDNDPDGDPLTPHIEAIPLNGTASINGDGSITYTPNSNYSGSDSFTYSVSDGRGGTSGAATVRITVTPVNDPPTAAFTAPASCTVNVPCQFTDNSTDVDGVIVTRSWNYGDGSATDALASHTYTTEGTPTVTLTVTDNDGANAAASALVNVGPP